MFTFACTASGLVFVAWLPDLCIILNSDSHISWPDRLLYSRQSATTVGITDVDDTIFMVWRSVSLWQAPTENATKSRSLFMSLSLLPFILFKPRKMSPCFLRIIT